jgi:CRISPR/Cas system-associated exonuclease Cas4 (RecB family)
MKKNEAKKLRKLQLSKETLRSLTAPEIQMVAGGSDPGVSCQSNCLGYANCAVTVTCPSDTAC